MEDLRDSSPWIRCRRQVAQSQRQRYLRMEEAKRIQLQVKVCFRSRALAHMLIAFDHRNPSPATTGRYRFSEGESRHCDAKKRGIISSYSIAPYLTLP